jgi:undecaprenyl pyrophosphate phosphatase UppP
MTSKQRAIWMRIIVACAVAAVALVIAGLLAREALPILAPLAVTLGVFALLMGLLVRRQSRE